MSNEKCPYCGEAGYSLRSVQCCLRELAQVKAERDKATELLKKMDENLRDALDCECYHGFVCPNCAVLTESRELVAEIEQEETT